MIYFITPLVFILIYIILIKLWFWKQLFFLILTLHFSTVVRSKIVGRNGQEINNLFPSFEAIVAWQSLFSLAPSEGKMLNEQRTKAPKKLLSPKGMSWPHSPPSPPIPLFELAKWHHPKLALSCHPGRVEKVQRIYLCVFVKWQVRGLQGAIYLRIPQPHRDCCPKKSGVSSYCLRES